MKYTLPITSMLGLLVIGAGLFLIFLNLDQRISLGSFCALFVGAILLLIRVYSTSALISLFLSGTASAAILGADTVHWHQPIKKKIDKSEKLFRSLLFLVISLLVLSIEEKIAIWLPVPDSILFASLILLSIGILLVGLSEETLPSFLGMLIIFLSFMLIYMLIESSLLTFAFMLGILMIMAFLGSMIMLQDDRQEESTSEDSE